MTSILEPFSSKKNPNETGTVSVYANVNKQTNSNDGDGDEINQSITDYINSTSLSTAIRLSSSSVRSSSKDEIPSLTLLDGHTITLPPNPQNRVLHINSSFDFRVMITNSANKLEINMGEYFIIRFRYRITYNNNLSYVSYNEMIVPFLSYDSIGIYPIDTSIYPVYTSGFNSVNVDNYPNMTITITAYIYRQLVTGGQECDFTFNNGLVEVNFD